MAQTVQRRIPAWVMVYFAVASISLTVAFNEGYLSFESTLNIAELRQECLDEGGEFGGAVEYKGEVYTTCKVERTAVGVSETHTVPVTPQPSRSTSTTTSAGPSGQPSG